MGWREEMTPDNPMWAETFDMQKRIKRHWWDQLRKDRRIRQCRCGAWLIRLISLRKNRKKLHEYTWTRIGGEKSDARPWHLYLKPYHRKHVCQGAKK